MTRALSGSGRWSRQGGTSPGGRMRGPLRRPVCTTLRRRQPADRLAALRYMIDHGTSIAYLQDGNDRGRLFAGQTMSVLWGDVEWLTLEEVADRWGLDEDTLRRLRRACGLPDPGGERACPAVEVELWQAAAAAIVLVGDETLSGFLWSLGAAATASSAEAASGIGACACRQSPVLAVGGRLRRVGAAGCPTHRTDPARPGPAVPARMSRSRGTVFCATPKLPRSSPSSRLGS